MTTSTRTAPKRRVRWAAGQYDAGAHAHVAGVARTLCGLPPIRDMEGWPYMRRCAACTRKLAELDR